MLGDGDFDLTFHYLKIALRLAAESGDEQIAHMIDEAKESLSLALDGIE